MMFKIGVLQKLFNMSDNSAKYQITDKISFQCFLGLSLGEHVPDAKTIWIFKDTLNKAGVIEELFVLFSRILEAKVIVTHTGTIIDATFVDATRQRNSREENEKIKNGETPKNGKKIPTGSVRKTLMHAGQKSVMKQISATKIM